MLNLHDHDPMEDLPFPEGVKMTDWAGVDWKDLPPERVQYITHKASRRGRVTAFLSQVPVGEGRKRENLPNLKAARYIQNSLYRAAKKLWGDNSIKIHVSRNEETDTYQVEFVHLSPPA